MDAKNASTVPILALPPAPLWRIFPADTQNASVALIFALPNADLVGIPRLGRPECQRGVLFVSLTSPLSRISPSEPPECERGALTQFRNPTQSVMNLNAIMLFSCFLSPSFLPNVSNSRVLSIGVRSDSGFERERERERRE